MSSHRDWADRQVANELAEENAWQPIYAPPAEDYHRPHIMRLPALHENERGNALWHSCKDELVKLLNHPAFHTGEPEAALKAALACFVEHPFHTANRHLANVNAYIVAVNEGRQSWLSPTAPEAVPLLQELWQVSPRHLQAMSLRAHTAVHEADTQEARDAYTSLEQAIDRCHALEAYSRYFDDSSMAEDAQDGNAAAGAQACLEAVNAQLMVLNQALLGT